VVDVTNFSPNTDYQARAELHLVERWTRTGPRTLAYEVTIEDSDRVDAAWTVKQEFGSKATRKQLYPEPALPRGNYGLPGLLRTARGRHSFAGGTRFHPQAGTTRGPYRR